MAEPWRVLVEQGTEALLAGRFGECERLAAEAVTAADPAAAEPGLLSVAACREQGRAAEAEIAMRALVAANPDHAGTRALLAAVLSDLGRDADARRQLGHIDLDEAPLPVCALAAETAAVLRLAPVAAPLLDRLERHATESVGFHGSLARHVGLLTHVLGDWHDAAEHLDAALAANRAAGAPVLVAHTCRHLSAVLRLRGKDGDWDRALDLLDEAADVYRRLDVDSRAEETEAVLRRSLDPGHAAAIAPRSDGPGWNLAYGGRSVVLAGVPGIPHLAAMVAAPHRPLHVLELVDSTFDPCLHDQLVAEFRSRLEELQAHAAQDPVAVSLAVAEADRLRADLAAVATAGESTPAPGEVVHRARRVVTVRLRSALERVDEVLPELGRHLRRSIHTGTFCLYEPAAVDGWTL